MTRLLLVRVVIGPLAIILLSFALDKRYNYCYTRNHENSYLPT